MRVKNTNKIAVIIFSLILVVSTGLLISMGGIDRQSEDNTVLHSNCEKYSNHGHGREYLCGDQHGGIQSGAVFTAKYLQ